MSSSIATLMSKLAKNNGFRQNALNILKFFVFGYRMQAKYFTDYSDTYIAILKELI